MPLPPVSRRSALALFGLVPLAGCAGLAEPPLPWTRLRSVSLDASPLAEKGLPTYAERVAVLGRPMLAAAFSDMLAPTDRGAPTAVVTVDTIHLAGSPDGDDGPFGWGDRDWISGRLTVATARGRPADRRSLYADRSPASSGPWYSPDFDQRRLVDLLRLYAAWARREFPT